LRVLKLDYSSMANCILTWIRRNKLVIPIARVSISRWIWKHAYSSIAVSLNSLGLTLRDLSLNPKIASFEDNTTIDLRHCTVLQTLTVVLNPNDDRMKYIPVLANLLSSLRSPHLEKLDLRIPCTLQDIGVNDWTALDNSLVALEAAAGFHLVMSMDGIHDVDFLNDVHTRLPFSVEAGLVVVVGCTPDEWEDYPPF